jgi:protein-disulfide isomerase
MRFYLKIWFIILLVIATTGLFFSIIFLSDFYTELEFLGAKDIGKTSQPRNKASLSLGLNPQSPSRGNLRARIKVAEFADFQCPFCKEEFLVLREIFAKYPDDIYFQYRHFPISKIHAQAEQAAQASMCARDQGKFWDMYDLIFKNQDDLSAKALKNLASILNLDAQEFDACLDSQKYVAFIERDFKDGLSLGVAATPTFFINGRKVQGVVPFDVWEEIIANF